MFKKNLLQVDMADFGGFGIIILNKLLCLVNNIIYIF